MRGLDGFLKNNIFYLFNFFVGGRGTCPVLLSFSWQCLGLCAEPGIEPELTGCMLALLPVKHEISN